MKQEWHEFWIIEGTYDGESHCKNPFYSTVSRTPDDMFEPIHVIEYTAYAELRAAAEKLAYTLEMYAQETPPFTGNRHAGFTLEAFRIKFPKESK